MMHVEKIGSVSARAGAHRLGNIDAVRGVAALLVVFQHAAERAGVFGAESRIFSAWFNPGQSGVIAFFLVSGFVIPLSLEKGRSLKRFVTSRILRIYPLYIVVFILTWVVAGGVLDAKTVFAQIVFASEYLHTRNYVGNSWTLLIEALWYVGFATLFSLGLNRSTWLLAVGCAAVIAVTAALALSGVRVPMGRVGMLSTCVVGLFAYRVATGQRQRECVRAGLFLIAAIAAGLVVGFGVVDYHGRVDFTLTAVALSWTAGYLLFFGSFVVRFPAALGGALRRMGQISFSVYLMHTFALWMTASIGLTGWRYVAGVFILSIPMAMVTYSVIELPAIRLSHRWPTRDPRAIGAEPIPSTTDAPGPANARDLAPRAPS